MADNDMADDDMADDDMMDNHQVILRSPSIHLKQTPQQVPFQQIDGKMQLAPPATAKQLWG